MGPPRLRPNWFRLRSGSSTPAWLLNQLLAENTLLRLDQKPSPCRLLVPDGVEKAACVAPPEAAALALEPTTGQLAHLPQQNLVGGIVQRVVANVVVLNVNTVDSDV